MLVENDRSKGMPSSLEIQSEQRSKNPFSHDPFGLVSVADSQFLRTAPVPITEQGILAIHN